MFTKNNWWIMIALIVWFLHFFEVTSFSNHSEPLMNLIPSYPDRDFKKLPTFLEIGSFALAVLIYISGFLYAHFLVEKRIDNSSNLLKNFSLIWIRPKVLTKRYGNLNIIPLFSALFWTGVLFSIAIPFTSFIVFFFKDSTDASYLSQPLNFIHSEGILITFFVVVITIYTFLNTIIIKAIRDKEIESLEELYIILKTKLNPQKNENLWENISHKFFYLLDFTPATGHYSKPELFVNNFLFSLKRFLVNPNQIEFKALVYKKPKNVTYYKKLIAELPEFKGKDLTRTPDKDVYEKTVEENIIIANDVFIEFLNKDERRDGHTYGIDKDYKIHYMPYRNAETQIPKTNIVGKEIARIIGETLYNPNVPKTDTEGNNINYCHTTQTIPNCKSFLLHTEEIGLTRFIVTNLFVIQFIAFKKKDSTNVPAGYITEDVTIIERYKKAFEQYLIETYT